MAQLSINASFTRGELQTLAWAVSSLVLERRGRGLGHPLDQPYPEPAEADLCCNFHTQDHTRRKQQHNALREQLQHTTELSQKMAQMTDHAPDDPSESPVINALHEALLDRGNRLGPQRLRHNEQEIWDRKIDPLLDDLTIPD